MNSEVIEMCEMIKSLKDRSMQNKYKIKPNMMNIKRKKKPKNQTKPQTNHHVSGFQESATANTSPSKSQIRPC